MTEGYGRITRYALLAESELTSEFHTRMEEKIEAYALMTGLRRHTLMQAPFVSRILPLKITFLPSGGLAKTHLPFKPWPSVLFLGQSYPSLQTGLGRLASLSPAGLVLCPSLPLVQGMYLC